jgi:hypothetical protein
VINFVEKMKFNYGHRYWFTAEDLISRFSLDNAEEIAVASRCVMRATDLYSRQLTKTTGLTATWTLVLPSFRNKGEVAGYWTNKRQSWKRLQIMRKNQILNNAIYTLYFSDQPDLGIGKGEPSNVLYNPARGISTDNFLISLS